MDGVGAGEVGHCRLTAGRSARRRNSRSIRDKGFWSFEMPWPFSPKKPEPTALPAGWNPVADVKRLEQRIKDIEALLVKGAPFFEELAKLGKDLA